RCTYACHSPEHGPSRRDFLGGVTLGALSTFGLDAMIQPAAAKELDRQQKRVLCVFLHGGVSQLETWDPKPGTDTGGPFRAIPTSVPGIHISELLPHTAKRMHRMALVRSLNTKEDDHGKGRRLMETGRREDPSTDYPHLGAVTAKLLGSENQALPGFLHVSPTGGGGFGSKDAAFLGPRYASVRLADGKAPPNLLPPDALTEGLDARREALRRKLNERFAKTRRTAQTEAYTASYDQAAQFIRSADVLDTSREPTHLQDLYGRHDFGRHCLLARRLLERGAAFVEVSHTNYDTHHENFDFHIEQMAEFDRTFATLLDDLADRGMLETTLVIVMSEFGRTPRINHRYGRDHWSKAWSVALAGCGIQAGAVVGKTNANGTAVTDREVGAGHLFHTYLRAVGLDPTRNFYPDQRPVPIADPEAGAIEEILA
ncbi:MAG TPA: DUF1501 domain-containing protein, partial [Gemmataceae bacterium]